MRVSKLLMAGAVSALLIGAAPTPASADWLLTPFVGANFGGNASFGDFATFDDEVERRVDFGASLGWMGKGIVGFEVDFGWSPNFFQNTNGDANFEFGDSNVTTLMANVLVGAPFGGQRGPGFRPYASGGLGLMRANATGSNFFNDLSTNTLGVFTDNVGIRGDIRYFRSLQDKEPDGELDLGLSDFDFWRGTVGVTFRW
jgi:hypothetical protein